MIRTQRRTDRARAGGPGGTTRVEALETRRLLAAATYPFSVSHFVEDPATKTIYAADTTDHAIAVIDATTLNVVAKIPVGSFANGLALSSDGSTLYVADAYGIDVIDTASQSAGTPLALPSGDFAESVQVGTNNRLWVLTTNSIMQIDATTGASTGPNLGTGSGKTPLSINYGGEITVSADGSSLYFAQHTDTPVDYLYKYDVSGTTGNELWTIAGPAFGDWSLSNDGSLAATYNNAGNWNATIYQTSNQAVVKTLPTNEVVNAFAFSPDNQYGYADVIFTAIDAFGLSNGLQTTSYSPLGNGNELFVDSTGQYLFAGETSRTEVFSTGRTAAVAPTITTQPQNVTVSAASSATFTAAASGTPSPTVQWQQSTDGGNTWTNINGATNVSYTVPQAGADAGDEFRAVFTNAGGSTTTNAATLTIASNGMLAFTQQPTGNVAGNLLTPALVVDVEDASGQLLTADNSQVTLSISSGPNGATLVGGVQANAVNGVATFPLLSLPVAGNYTLKASDGTLTPGYTTTFTSSGTPGLAFVRQPTDAIAGFAMTPPVVVDVNNPSGTLNTTDNSLVTLSIFSGPAGAYLGGTVTVNAVNGVATFDDVIPTKPGTYVLEATDGPDSPAKSVSLQVTPGAGGPTSTALSTSAPSVANGDAVIFTATVTGSGGTPTGTVQFFDNGTPIGVQTLSNGTASLTTGNLPSGVQNITAVYFGTGGFAGSTSATVVETVASEARLSASVTGTSPAVLVPGNPASVQVTLVNQGNSTARGSVGIQLYATTDGVASDGVAIAAHPAQTGVLLRSGGSKTVRLSFTVPSSLTPGSYRLMAVLTPAGRMTAANIAAATPTVGGSIGTSTVSLSFGTVVGRRGVKLVRIEPDGTVVTYSLTGPGTGTLAGDGITSPAITLVGTTPATRLTITTRGGANGLTLAGLSADGPIGSIMAPTTTLAGVLEVQGAVGQLVLGSLIGSNLAAASFKSVMIDGSMANSHLLAGTNFGADGLPGGGDDTYAAGAIGAVRILGNVTSSIIAAGLNPVDGIYLNGNDVLIPGGQVGRIAISGSLSADSRVLASLLPNTALVSGSALNPASDSRFRF